MINRYLNYKCSRVRTGRKDKNCNRTGSASGQKGLAHTYAIYNIKLRRKSKSGMALGDIIEILDMVYVK